MMKSIGTLVIDTDRCKGCGLCVEACPKHAIGLTARKVNAAGYPFAEMVGEDCSGCASCGIICPDACITVYRKKYDGE